MRMLLASTVGTMWMNVGVMLENCKKSHAATGKNAKQGNQCVFEQSER